MILVKLELWTSAMVVICEGGARKDSYLRYEFVRKLILNLYFHWLTFLKAILAIMSALGILKARSKEVRWKMITVTLHLNSLIL